MQSLPDLRKRSTRHKKPVLLCTRGRLLTQHPVMQISQICTSKVGGVSIEDSMTTINFPSARWSFWGSDSYRGQGSVGQEVAFIFADELTTYLDSDNLRSVIDTYGARGTNVIACTTPGQSLVSETHKLFTEQESMYHRTYLNYTYGLPPHSNLYKPGMIDLLKRTSESFLSEYDLQWGKYYTSGSVYARDHIQHALTQSMLSTQKASVILALIQKLRLLYSFPSKTIDVLYSSETM